MNIEKGFKMLISKENGKTSVEIKRHKEDYMDNILIINSKGSKRYEDVWIIEKDLDSWLFQIKKEGFTIIKIEEDVESPKKGTKNKK